MKSIFTSISALLFAAFLFAGCGEDKKGDNEQLARKKTELEKLQKDQASLSDKILKLQAEIAELDPDAAVKAKLVSIQALSKDSFEHYIDLQGIIDARNVAYVSPRGAGGMVTAVFVKEGDRVTKGQTILKLDPTLYQQQVVAAEQQIGGIKAQLEQAQSIYERQQNLWKNNIGTEVQVMNAKTALESLQSQYNAASENIKLAKEQLNTTNVTAAISGTINTINIKVGEFFAPGSQQVQIVNSNELKVRANVPENYLDRVSAGDKLMVTLPELNNKTITTKVSVQGKVIDPVTRSFYIEGTIPADPSITPNQVALVRINDYNSNEALTIPVNIIQNDEQGKYIMLAVTEKGKLIARKRSVEIGEMYQDKMEIKSGLSEGDTIITDGFQGLYEGQIIETLRNPS